MRILIVSDAWHPQVNGVVRTLTTLASELKTAGHEAVTITPDQFRSIPCPTYPEIRLALEELLPCGNCLSRYRPDQNQHRGDG